MPSSVTKEGLVLSEVSATERLREAYHKHHQMVFRTCLRFAAGDRHWAMDRSQDVFVKLGGRLDHLRDLDDLGGWLHRVAVNTCLKSLRKQKNWLGRLQGLWRTGRPSVPTAERTLQGRRDVEKLKESIRKLPANVAAVLTMVYLEQRSQNEAAADLGFSKGYVSKLHAKGIAALKKDDWEID